MTRSLAPGAWLVLMFSCVRGMLTQGVHREDVGARGAGVWDQVGSSRAYIMEGGHSQCFQMKK